MTRDQAKALIRAADALPETLGAGAWWNEDGSPCCAEGHLLVAAGATSATGDDRCAELLGDVFGFPYWSSLSSTNDVSTPETRRHNVLADIEDWVREAGFDPDELRVEVAAV